MAFMDLRQPVEGHTLVVPKQHIPDIFGLDDTTGASLMSTVVRVASAVREAFAPDAINVWQSNGAAAGQEVFHLHVHVMPRRTGDGLLRVYGAPPAPRAREDLDRQAVAIRRVVEDTRD